MDLFESAHGVGLDLLKNELTSSSKTEFEEWLAKHAFYKNSPAYKSIWNPVNVVEAAYQLYVVNYWAKSSKGIFINPTYETPSKDQEEIVKDSLNAAILLIQRTLPDYQLYGPNSARVKSINKHLKTALLDQWNLWVYRNKGEIESRGSMRLKETENNALLNVKLDATGVSQYLFHCSHLAMFKEPEWLNKRPDYLKKFASLENWFPTNGVNFHV